jgi:hypothetical protein
MGAAPPEHFDLARVARQRAEEGYGFLLATNGSLVEEFDLSPDGIELGVLDFTAEEAHRAEHGWRISDFLRIYNLMNGQSFSPPEMAMPMWIMIDLGLMPSGFVIMTRERHQIDLDMAGDELDPETRRIMGELLALADRLGHRGPIPVAAYCAAPSARHDRWIGWSLCTAERGKRLGEIVKGLALKAYRAKVVLGVAQLTSPALRVHSRFGALRIVVAKLALHTAPHTFVYECDLRPWLSNRPEQLPPASFLLDPRDDDAVSQMQADIDHARAEYYVLAPGSLRVGGEARVPILRVGA